MTEPLVDRLFLGQVASCSCLTKTPDTQYHDEHCKYRLLSEAADRIRILESALRWYASGHHFMRDDSAWDTVTGEPQNFWCDEAGSTVEDGTIAKKFLLGEWTKFDADDQIPLLPEERPTLETAVGCPHGVPDENPCQDCD